MKKDITLNPRKSTCILQVECGSGDDKAIGQRIAVILENLHKVLLHELPAEGVNYKVEERIVKSYSHDPYWAEMIERHKKERAQIEAYLDSLEKPQQDEFNVMRFPTIIYRTKRISVQL